MIFLEVLKKDKSYSYKKHSYIYQKLKYNILTFTSFIDFFAKIAMLLFCFFGTVSLAIGEMKSKDKKIAINFFKYFL